jgi:hypothetical protein
MLCPAISLFQKEYGSDRQGSTKYLAAFLPEPIVTEIDES